MLPQGHERIDRRSLALHHAIAEKLRARPELLAIARGNLERWAATAGRSAPYLDEWARILDRPLEEVLRQCSPFAGVLEPKERWAAYARFERSADVPGEAA